MGRRWGDIRRLTGDQCKEIIDVPEQYRRTGRGPTGFEMRYVERKCWRRQKENGYCWQHQKEARDA